MGANKGTVAVMGAGGYMAGPICEYLKRVGGYYVIGLIRPSTDDSALTSDIVHVVVKGDLTNSQFIRTSIKENSPNDDSKVIAIINFINQLMPPRDTVLKQLTNDLPPIQAGLQAALSLDCTFIHTSGNFSIPTFGNIGGTFTTQLPTKPDSSTDKVEELDHWYTFAHEGGMAAVSVLAEAKHREDWCVEDFMQNNKSSKAIVVIPAGIYGPGIGKKITFWDYAAAQFLEQKFVDFAHAFLHIEDAAIAYLSIVDQLVENPSKIWEHTNAGNLPGQNLKSKRLALCGESMTVRDFVARYASACNVEMLKDDVGPKVSNEERKRIYDDTATKQLLNLQYKHTLLMTNTNTTNNNNIDDNNDNKDITDVYYGATQSLLDSVENLRKRRLLMVKC